MEEPSGGESAGEAESRMAVEEAAGAAEATGEEEREARPEIEPEPEPEREDNQLTEAALPPVPTAGSSQEIAEDLSSDEGNESQSSEESSCSGYGSHDRPGTALQRVVSDAKALLPDTFQTNNLLFYERFKTYQDYMLADCKASEVKEFTAEYLEKVLEPSGWQAIWRTNAFEVLVEVANVDYTSLKAVVRLSQPFRCRVQEGSFTSEQMCALLELKEHQLPLQELSVVFDDSGEFDQTALAIEHVRFFYKHIWRSWDEEDDDFDYFVRCVEPRLRLYYDIMEDRISPALVSDYHSRLSQCKELYGKFQVLRNSLSACDSDSEKDNVSVVEGMKLYDKIEHLKQQLEMIENFLFRYVFGYKKHAGLKAKGTRSSNVTITHIVCATIQSSFLQCLVRDKLSPEHFNEDIEIQFHHDPQSALNACYEGDRVIICPGHYIIEGALPIADSVALEGYGLPDDIVIEKQGKPHAFVECTGKDVKISNLKLIQRDTEKGILSVHQGRTTLENCVLQCGVTGVAVRTSAEFLMKNSDLYGAKGAGIEIHPGSTCILTGNGLHHCREGILIKNFLDEQFDVPKITMKNNVIHNNEGYGVLLMKPKEASEVTPESTSEQPKESASAEDAITEICEGPHELDCGEVDPYGRDDDDNEGEGNFQISKELWATSLEKKQLCQKRLSQLEIPEADSQTSQEMFVSILGNQFKRNGKGCFGTFLY
ncbi:SHC SH2 domain-binding protein 1 isoform X1 [Pituophis catenifer annectens]|uniref:SHC SH2 domain-binding protein 1 isoform X1 n=1 Tax=Pituophis catenifer annectens TaxID=94852 RepID=UPI003994BD54